MSAPLILPPALTSRRTLLRGAAGLTAAALLPACEPRLSGLLTSSDTHPGDYPTVLAVEYMGDLLARATNGRLGIKIYPGGQLGSEADMLEITSFGGIDLLRVNLAPLNSIAPATIPFALPFVFGSVPQMRQVVDSAIGDEVLASLEPYGLIGLAFYDSGARHIYNTRGPLRTPADLAGLKLRVPPSDLYIAMVNALGANAVPIAFGESYQALAQGVIDGAENNWPSFESARHYEVARYMSLTGHLLTPEALVMSKASWDDLSPPDRLLVVRAAKLSVPYMRRVWDERVATAEATIRASGVAVNPVDPAPFVAAMRPVWDQFIVTDQQASIVERMLAMQGMTR